MLKNLEDDSHVKTRICQYQALQNGKGVYVAKQRVLAKPEGQNRVLEKYGLKPHDSNFRRLVETVDTESLETARKRLISIEGK